MSARPHEHSPIVHSPLVGQPVNLSSRDNGVHHLMVPNSWLESDPYASPSPHSARPTSAQSSRPSSAGSAAHFYAQETGFYVPSPGPTNSSPHGSSRYKDVRRPPSPQGESTVRSDERRVRRQLIPPPTKIITPAERRAPPMMRLTDANLEAHTKTTSQTHKSPRYVSSVATSLSMYSQESAPRSHHYPPFTGHVEAEVPFHNRSTHEIGCGLYTNDSSSDYQSTVVSRTTAPTTPQQSTWQLVPPDMPRNAPSQNAWYYPTPEVFSIPQQTVKEPKVVRYAMTQEVYTPDPRIISYISAGPNAASSINVAYTGIRNQVSKRGNAKHKPSASTSANVHPAMSSSASVRSLPTASGRKEHYLLKRKHHDKSFRDGETQSLYSAKSTATVSSAGKRFLSFFRFRRFLPGGKKKTYKSNLSNLDLDAYEVNRYFSKT